MAREQRVDPITDELLGWFDAQRNHAVGILDGLSDEDLRRQLLPSGWSCLGMIGHLAGLERFWFRQVMLGEPEAPSDLPVSVEWQVPADIPAEAVFDSYRREIERSNQIIRATPLDAEPLWWPEFFGAWRLPNLRAILLHTLTETGTHAGHLDSARELIDGRLWLKLE